MNISNFENRNFSSTNSLILLDAARIGESILYAKEINTSFDSLYRGRSEADLEAVAPYIFTVSGKEAFINWVFGEGWGNSWGILIATSASFEECWTHFRKFLLVKTEDGEELYFRFYDPRVLKIFLPTCDKSQLMDFFGPIHKFIVEGDDKETSIQFELVNGELQQSMIQTASLFRINDEQAHDLAATKGDKKRQQIIVIEEDKPSN